MTEDSENTEQEVDYTEKLLLEIRKLKEENEKQREELGAYRCREHNRAVECSFCYDVVSTQEENAVLRSDLNKAKNIIHKLLVLIIDRKWWNYQTIDEARFFMKE